MRLKWLFLKSFNVLLLLWVAALFIYVGLSIWTNQAGFSLILFCFSVGFSARAIMSLRQKEMKLRYNSRAQVWMEMLLYACMYVMVIKLLIMNSLLLGNLFNSLIITIFFDLIRRILEWYWLRGYSTNPNS